LRDSLTALPADQVLAFDREFQNQLARSYTWNLWGAGYVINGGCSDDCFEYFRAWLIMQGRQTFERALQDGDSLAAHPRLENPAELEDVLQVTRAVYQAKAGKEPEFAVKRPKLGEGWNFDDPALMKQKYPKLCARFGC
jgi:hypothetical protein